MPFALDGTSGESHDRGPRHRPPHRLHHRPGATRAQDRARAAAVFGTFRHLRHAALAGFSQLTTGRGRGGKLYRSCQRLRVAQPACRLHLALGRQAPGQPRRPIPAGRSGGRAIRPRPHGTTARASAASIAACVARRSGPRARPTVRDFIAEFRGLARTDVRAQVLDTSASPGCRCVNSSRSQSCWRSCSPACRTPPSQWQRRTSGCSARSTSSPASKKAGADPETFRYRRCAVRCRRRALRRRGRIRLLPQTGWRRCLAPQIVGVNWSPSLINPFRHLERRACQSRRPARTEQRAGAERRADHPRDASGLAAASAYTDKAKSALVLPARCEPVGRRRWRVSPRRWAKVRKAEERDASRASATP